MSLFSIQDTTITDIADAIRSKTGKTASMTPIEMPDEIESISGGGGAVPVERKDVNFYDYDGTILHSYSAAEALSLTALPENPSHSGLTAQGWNWSLADAKAYVAEYGALNIGQMYKTSDDKTHIFIHLEKGRTSPMLGCCPNGTVDVDWGDDTTHDTLTGTSVSTAQWTPTHNYAQPGNYEIVLTCTGTMGLYGSSTTNQGSGLLRYASGSDTRNRGYQNAIQEIYFADNVTYIMDNAFQNCYSLSSVTISQGITSIGDNAFRNCYSLSAITIPQGVTSIGNSTFSNCYSLSSVTIPQGVTSIWNSAFSTCSGMAEYHFLPTTPPTLANTNAFSAIQSDCIIYVPAGSLEAYQTATNWSTYASHMQEEAA